MIYISYEHIIYCCMHISCVQWFTSMNHCKLLWVRLRAQPHHSLQYFTKTKTNFLKKCQFGEVSPYQTTTFPAFRYHPLSGVTPADRKCMQWFLQHAIFLTTFLEINLAASTSLTKVLAPSFG